MITDRQHCDWRAAGSCRAADPDLFFPVSMTGRSAVQVAAAKTVCAGCPVRSPCLGFALAHHEVEGIWGGTTVAERRHMRQASATLGPGRLASSEPAATACKWRDEG